MKKIKRHIHITIINRIAILLLIATALSVVANLIYRREDTQASANRYDLAHYANQFMDASAYLTDEVRAYAATGDRIHYDNYRKEIDVLHNREEGIEKLKEIGITKKEETLIDRMMYVSDTLVPLEIEAMELAESGDTTGALNIVYGSFYNASIEQIRLRKDEFLELLDSRTAAHAKKMATIYNIITLTTWLLVVLTILLQVYQRNALYRLAYVDPLTGGNNYNAFCEKMHSGTGVSGEGYVVSADLKGFGAINDTCGVAKGDEVIRQMSLILERNMHQGELSAHVIGDRFVFFVHSANTEYLINRLRNVRAEIVNLSKILDVPHVSPMFGIRAVESADMPEIGYSDANLAKMFYEDRIDSHYAVYDKDMQKKLLDQQVIEDRFEPALREHQFEMWYQPKYEPKDKKLIGAEALVRWRNPDDSLNSPGTFIPIFERNGMIAQLDEYTFETVCEQQQEWMDQGFRIIPVSVNVSRASLLYTDIVERYLDIIGRYQIPISCIDLEITESAMDSNDRIDETLLQFHNCGFRILVDDFGSGYSSLSTLTKGYFDCIKIDKSLVDCVDTPEGSSLVESTIHLAHRFEMTVTAEGVEEKEQVDSLINLSCDNIQGYYYSRPLPVEQFTKLMEKHNEL